MVNFTVRYLGSRGRNVEHEAGCDCSATQVPQLYRNEEPLYPALNGEACTDQDLKLCDETCTGWGIETPTEVVCVP